MSPNEIEFFHSTRLFLPAIRVHELAAIKAPISLFLSACKTFILHAFAARPFPQYFHRSFVIYYSSVRAKEITNIQCVWSQFIAVRQRLL